MLLGETVFVAAAGSGVSSRTIGSDEIPPLHALLLDFCESPFIACTALALVVFMLEVSLAAGFFRAAVGIGSLE